MSIPFRNEDGTITFMALSINCKEIEIKRPNVLAVKKNIENEDKDRN